MPRTIIECTRQELDENLAECGYKLNDKMSFNTIHDGIHTRIAYVVEIDTGFHYFHNYARKDKNYDTLQLLIRCCDYMIKGRIHYLW